jgi:hypothetical protein
MIIKQLLNFGLVLPFFLTILIFENIIKWLESRFKNWIEVGQIFGWWK